MALKNFSIREYSDLEAVSLAFNEAFKSLGIPGDCSIEFKVSMQTFDRIGRYMWNRRLTTIDLTEYTEMSLTINGVRIKLVIRK